MIFILYYKLNVLKKTCYLSVNLYDSRFSILVWIKFVDTISHVIYRNESIPDILSHSIYEKQENKILIIQ